MGSCFQSFCCYKNSKDVRKRINDYFSARHTQSLNLRETLFGYLICCENSVLRCIWKQKKTQIFCHNISFLFDYQPSSHSVCIIFYVPSFPLFFALAALLVVVFIPHLNFSPAFGRATRLEIKASFFWIFRYFHQKKNAWNSTHTCTHAAGD